jgi:hypothetical protein
MNTTEETIHISLSKHQALVLFEWLTKQDESDTFKYDHDAEQCIVWKLQAQLERTLVEPFREDYLSKLEQARNKVAAESKSIAD